MKFYKQKGEWVDQATANKIFDILVKYAGAREGMRREFVYHHTKKEYRHWIHISEFRFQGELGFGGKLWVDGNRVYVDCYSEDETKKRLKIIKEVNKLLSSIDPNS